MPITVTWSGCWINAGSKFLFHCFWCLRGGGINWGFAESTLDSSISLSAYKPENTVNNHKRFSVTRAVDDIQTTPSECRQNKSEKLCVTEVETDRTEKSLNLCRKKCCMFYWDLTDITVELPLPDYFFMQCFMFYLIRQTPICNIQWRKCSKLNNLMHIWYIVLY